MLLLHEHQINRTQQVRSLLLLLKLETSTKNFPSHTNPIPNIVRQATLNGRAVNKKYEMKDNKRNYYTHNSAELHFNGLAFIFQLNGKIRNRKCHGRMCCEDFTFKMMIMYHTFMKFQFAVHTCVCMRCVCWMEKASR